MVSTCGLFAHIQVVTQLILLLVFTALNFVGKIIHLSEELDIVTSQILSRFYKLCNFSLVFNKRRK